MDWLLDFFFPKKCAGCGQLGGFLCKSCKGSLKLVSPKCPGCLQISVTGETHKKCRNKTSLDGLMLVFGYRQKRLRKIIKVLKYKFCRELVEELLRGMDVGVEKGDFELIVPVPLHKRRLNWRGFNQAEIIGRLIAKNSGTRMENIVERVKFTKPLAGIKNKKDRGQIMEDVFEVTGEVKNKRVLVVDDVFTTGVTMNEVARKCRESGASEVWGWVLAG